jgi:hypothetical protein
MGVQLIFKSPIDRLLLVGCHPYITAKALLVLQRKQLLNFLSCGWIRVKLLLDGKIGKQELIFMLLELEEISIIQLHPSLCTPQYSVTIYFPYFKIPFW